MRNSFPSASPISFDEARGWSLTASKTPPEVVLMKPGKLTERFPPSLGLAVAGKSKRS
jgi:hypothetical protein